MIMIDNFKKYGELFQVDHEHFEEFFSLLKHKSLLKSEFFLKQGDKCKYLGFIKNAPSEVFILMIREGRSTLGFTLKMNFLLIMKVFCAIKYPI
jgi:hypothetical protein